LRATVLACLLLLSSVAAKAAEPPVVRMEQIIQSYVTEKTFMGAVLVVSDGKPLLDKGYGFADLEWNIPNTPATKFRLGSITKQFTAASILLLEERGKLKLTDPVRRYLPDLPESWDKITIFNLLTHTSGISDYTSPPGFNTFKGRNLTPQQIIDLVRDKPLGFQPGEKYGYSSTGYVLLGMVIEKLGGRPYAEFLQANIFAPLGMKDTGCYSQAILPLAARGYQRSYERDTDGVLKNADFVDGNVLFAAGSLYSTTHDLLTWERALFAGKVVKPGSLARMATPFKNNYGLGLSISSGEHREIWHNGNVDGFASMMANYPSDRLTIIVLDNVGTNAPRDMAEKLADIAFGKPVVLPSERKEVPVDRRILARYVGHYRMTPAFAFDITLEGNALFFQATHQDKVPIFPESPKDFFVKVVDAQFSFIADGDGPATAVVMHQNGQSTTGARVP